MSVDIVIVNWNSGDLLKDCVNSIVNLQESNQDSLGRVIVVDNNSSDSSIDFLKRGCEKVLLVKNKNNEGFAAGCNKGATHSVSENILFLNPDTRLEGNVLRSVCDKLAANADIGIIGVRHTNSNGEVAVSCSRFPSLMQVLNKATGLNAVFPNIFKSHFMSDWDHKSDRYVDQVMGAFFMVPKDLFKKLGGFDERFFVYYEEVDFCYRAKKAGYKTFFMSTVSCYHHGCGTSNSVKALRLFYSWRSRYLYFNKHRGYFASKIILVTTLLIEFPVRVLNLIAKKEFHSIQQVILAFRMMMVWVSRT